MLNIAGTIQVIVDGFMGIIHKYVLEFIILGFCLLGVCWGIGYFANALYGMHFELASCWAGFTAIGGAGVLASVKYCTDSWKNSAPGEAPAYSVAPIKAFAEAVTGKKEESKRDA